MNRLSARFPTGFKVLQSASLLLIALLAGCGNPGPVGPVRVETYGITGKVLVDGEPAKAPMLIAVRANPEGGIESSATKTIPNAYADPDGTFSLSTYEKGDGVAPGTYKITFQGGQIQLFSGRYEGDAFNGKYNDPATTEYTVTVTGSETAPIDMGTIDLKTQ